MGHDKLDGLHSAIKASFAEAGLEPVKFEKPLKNVGVTVVLRKRVTPKSIVERHAVIGWGLGNLMEHFGKDLFNIKSVI